jgi:hypothetical protein
MPNWLTTELSTVWHTAIILITGAATWWGLDRWVKHRRGRPPDA